MIGPAQPISTRQHQEPTITTIAAAVPPPAETETRPSTERSRQHPAGQGAGGVIWTVAAILMLFLALPLVALVWRGLE
ncbi:MAG: hypothetical protein M3411_02375, partial [Chloroflexota bacterium]|nr:hypothetical protein [Chloroflexota bacterium]